MNSLLNNTQLVRSAAVAVLLSLFFTSVVQAETGGLKLYSVVQQILEENKHDAERTRVCRTGVASEAAMVLALQTAFDRGGDVESIAIELRTVEYRAMQWNQKYDAIARRVYTNWDMLLRISEQLTQRAPLKLRTMVEYGIRQSSALQNDLHGCAGELSALMSAIDELWRNIEKAGGG